MNAIEAVFINILVSYIIFREFWLGLEKLHKLTKRGAILKIEITDWQVVLKYLRSS